MGAIFNGRVEMIKFDEVGKTYPNGVQALKDVSLTIEDGEFVAIIGLSGSGKSTLLRTINKMHSITAGKLEVNNQDVSLLKGKKLMQFRHKIGMVFQSFNLINRSSVFNNVLVARAYHLNFLTTIFKMYSKEDQRIALEAIERVGLLDKAFTRVDNLSGGQKQRVALARTIAQEPSIILADEPVAALDPVTAKMIMDDFKRVNRDLNITVLINMHHVDLALEYADRVIAINDGRIVFDGSSQEVTKQTLDMIYDNKLTEDDFMEK